MGPPDLSLIPTDDLLAALKARFDNLIFLGEQKQGPTDEWMPAWQGHATYCVGMCADLIRAIQDWTLDPNGHLDDLDEGGEAGS